MSSSFLFKLPPTLPTVYISVILHTHPPLFYLSSSFSFSFIPFSSSFSLEHSFSLLCIKYTEEIYCIVIIFHSISSSTSFSSSFYYSSFYSCSSFSSSSSSFSSLHNTQQLLELPHSSTCHVQKKV